jgi:tRNA pseudouridine65 synthase
MNIEEPQILYQDPYYIAVNKPAGLAVHRSPMTRDQKRFLVQVLRTMTGKKVYPVHRLDRPTGGVILLAFDSGATRRMAESFNQHGVNKVYMAIVRGYTPGEDTIDHPLTKSTDAIGRLKERRTAVTRYRRLATTELPIAVGRYETARYSLLRVWPVTGRQHQIRRHLNHISHPIVGDRKYGDNHHNRFFTQHFNCRRLLLFATDLGFVHPYSGQTIQISAGPDRQIRDLIQTLGWQDHLE